MLRSFCFCEYKCCISSHFVPFIRRKYETDICLCPSTAPPSTPIKIIIFSRWFSSVHFKVTQMDHPDTNLWHTQLCVCAQQQSYIMNSQRDIDFSSSPLSLSHLLHPLKKWMHETEVARELCSILHKSTLYHIRRFFVCVMCCTPFTVIVCWFWVISALAFIWESHSWKPYIFIAVMQIYVHQFNTNTQNEMKSLPK